MFEQILSFILKYKYIFLFYLAIIFFLFFKRKKLDIQAKFILLYRTKFGLKFMEKFSQKHQELLILLGYIGVGIGFIGMILMIGTLLYNLVELMIKPSAVSGVSLVLPGMTIPGLGLLPFWYWLLAIFLIAMVHEFAHGLVARAHKIPVKNTGLVFIGPIIGAFVEPSEKKLQKEQDIKQYSVLAAGSFSNILLALVALLLLNFVFTPLQQTMTEPQGFTFDSYVNTSLPFAQAGIAPGTLITSLNGEKTSDFSSFSEKLFCLKAGDKILVGTPEKDYPLVLASSPDTPSKGFLGIKEIRNEIIVKETYQKGIGKIIYKILEWFNGLNVRGHGFLFWLYILSSGIGLFNLLPLPIIDGGRMVQVYLHKKKGKEKGEKRYKQIGLFFLLVLLLNLIYPWLRGLLGI